MTVDLEPIDRLEDKVRRLVALVDRLRSDQARAADENLRLARELASARDRLTEVERGASEIVHLREEREVVRARVAEMLHDLEALNL
jgi:regulator of replication initiation timing